ncbi:MAG TPA: TolC family protein, partial [Steroidobacteraceae bacterium]|nr:TolC family protein [Steroidobacteraceae bacterium]
MSRRALPLFVAFVVCAAFAGLRPAKAQDTRIITFDEAVRIALEQNATLRQTENATEASRVAVEQARARFLPDLSLSTRGTRSFGRTFSESEGRIVDRSTDTVNVGASSSVTLFDGFANVASLREARFGEAASTLDLERTRETVVFTVAANFLALVQQQEQLRVQRENLAAESALEREIASYVEAATSGFSNASMARSTSESMGSFGGAPNSVMSA